MRLSFSLSTTKITHVRTSGTFLAWLSDVGGLRDAMILIISPVIGYVSALRFSLSITNDQPSLLRQPSTHESKNLQLASDKQSRKLYKRIETSESYKLDKVDIANLLNPIR